MRRGDVRRVEARWSLTVVVGEDHQARGHSVQSTHWEQTKLLGLGKVKRRRMWDVWMCDERMMDVGMCDESMCDEKMMEEKV